MIMTEEVSAREMRAMQWRWERNSLYPFHKRDRNDVYKVSYAEDSTISLCTRIYYELETIECDPDYDW